MMNYEIMNEFDTTNVSKLIDTYETFQTETEDDAVDMTRITNRIGESSLIVYEVLMQTGFLSDVKYYWLDMQ